MNSPEITHFIQKAIDDLSKKINLYDYDLVVMPESSSKVNQYMLRYIYRFAQPMLREMELVKSLPEKLSSQILYPKKSSSCLMLSVKEMSL